MSAEPALIAVLDYGIGNLRSAQKALQHVGADARLTADPGLVRDAAAVVLPGVGAFGACLDALREADLEDTRARGLGIIPGTVSWIPPGVKRPQMQWNRLHLQLPDDPMFAGLGDRPWMYFVHSLHGVPSDPADVAATCDYGGPVNAAFRRENVFATQFHPEKSASAGLALLGNFVTVSTARVSA